jgi:hypothetical protein
MLAKLSATPAEEIRPAQAAHSVSLLWPGSGGLKHSLDIQ